MKLFLVCMAVTAAMAGETAFTVAGLRVKPDEWNKTANLARIERYARMAAARGAKLVITPEGFLEGYVGNDKKTKDLDRAKYLAVGELIDGPMLTRIRSLAAELKIFLLVGFAERRGGEMFNSVVMFSPEGRVVTRYSKTHTANDEPFNAKGVEFPVVNTPLGRLGTLICMDRQLPETSRILAIKGAQMILVPAWGMYGETNDILMRVRAYENGVFVAFVHPFRCLFIDPRGKIIAQDKGGGDELVFATVDLGAAHPAGPIQHRRPEIYGDLVRP